MEHRALGRTDPPQGLEDLVVRVAVVDLQREPVLLRERRCAPRTRGTARRDRRRPGAEEVEPGLADRAHPRLRRELVDDGECVVERAGRHDSGASFGWIATAASTRGSMRGTSADQREVARSRADLHDAAHADAATRGRAARATSSGSSPSAISRCVWLS